MFVVVGFVTVDERRTNEFTRGSPETAEVSDVDVLGSPHIGGERLLVTPPLLVLSAALGSITC